MTIFNSILNVEWDNNRIVRDLYLMYNKKSIQQLRDNIDVFFDGNCIIYHMFGNEVVNILNDNYDDAYISAQLEVSEEMLDIAMEINLVWEWYCRVYYR